MKTQIHYLIIIPFALCSCQTETMNNSSISVVKEVQINHNYDEISEYELVWESIFDVTNSIYYVYFYSTGCSHCEELKSFIVETALERGDIYFVKGTSRDQITSDTKKLIGAENPGDIWILGYPSLIKISNQKVTKNLAGVSQIKAELK